jgi:hypothetical protein
VPLICGRWGRRLSHADRSHGALKLPPALKPTDALCLVPGPPESGDFDVPLRTSPRSVARLCSRCAVCYLPSFFLLFIPVCSARRCGRSNQRSCLHARGDSRQSSPQSYLHAASRFLDQTGTSCTTVRSTLIQAQLRHLQAPAEPFPDLQQDYAQATFSVPCTDCLGSAHDTDQDDESLVRLTPGT